MPIMPIEHILPIPFFSVCSGSTAAHSLLFSVVCAHGIPQKNVNFTQFLLVNPYKILKLFHISLKMMDL